MRGGMTGPRKMGMDMKSWVIVIVMTMIPTNHYMVEDAVDKLSLGRTVLDFNFEKFCSVSLSNLNVYAFLVCGKYYQGRGKNSHAYTHSLEAGHHVYINLQTEKVYCLPDGYEINDHSLDDIHNVLNPRMLSYLTKISSGLGHLMVLVTFLEWVGLNNIKETDFVNVTIQSLMRVTPLRNLFLIPENYQHCKSPLVHRFGELTRKIWHSRNFKGLVSPHEFLQAVMKASKKRFHIGAQSDPIEFMSWLLNTLHADLKSSKKNTSIIYDCFQGELEVAKEIPNKSITDKKENCEDLNKNEKNSDGATERDAFVKETSKMPFLMLGLDLPPPPVLKDVMEKNIILQVPLFNILKKFDAGTVTELVRPHIARMRYRVTKLPKYFIIHMRRFTKNNFFVEKNPTLELGDSDSDDDDSNEPLYGGRRSRQIESWKDCPYLDTVNRQVLDFDFEKFCSVSLSNLNVYACLVCGKCYQGRGKNSHAYTHSLEAGHHVYINLQTEKVYCLPDGYEINDPSLDDIRLLQRMLSYLTKISSGLGHLMVLVTFLEWVGLNNIKETDFVNVTIQSLMRVTPLRNLFLIPENYQHCKSPLVSPHEFLQAVMKASKKRFRIGAQSDPVEFMSWLFNTLHADLKSSKKNTSIIYGCFQGELEVVKEIPNKGITDKKENCEDLNKNEKISDGVCYRERCIRQRNFQDAISNARIGFATASTFQICDGEKYNTPGGCSLNHNSLAGRHIQEWGKECYGYTVTRIVPLFNILKKFDGVTVTEVVRPHIVRMRYRVTKLPKYIIIHIRRFTKNDFFVEKNPTLVNFPVKNLELKDYIPLPTPKENEKLRSIYG
ncbi:hypothetical protein HN51_024668 [Arachis hypogaea]